MMTLKLTTECTENPEKDEIILISYGMTLLEEYNPPPCPSQEGTMFYSPLGRGVGVGFHQQLKCFKGRVISGALLMPPHSRPIEYE